VQEGGGSAESMDGWARSRRIGEARESGRGIKAAPGHRQGADRRGPSGGPSPWSFVSLSCGSRAPAVDGVRGRHRSGQRARAASSGTFESRAGVSGHVEGFWQTVNGVSAVWRRRNSSLIPGCGCFLRCRY
jgi:hypothetical protein